MSVIERQTTVRVANAEPVPLEEIPVLEFDEFAQQLQSELQQGLLSALFVDQPLEDRLRMYAVVGRPVESVLAVFATDVEDSYPSLTPRIPQAHWFEREIAEQWGVVPQGHPWLKPLRWVRSNRPGRDAWGRTDGEIVPNVQPPPTEFFRVDGPEIHEVAVGPIHASVIEPGHFRFQCHGEHVYHLEVSLGYQHRGVERALIGGPNKRSLHYLETVAGDTTIGHATAYCHAIEALAGIKVPPKAHCIRGIALELERLANHTGDLGGLSNDVAFVPTASFCGRLRGDFLNSTAAICGNRFGRSLVVPGGVRFDVENERADQLVKRIETAFADVDGAASLLWKTPSVLARFEDTGPVSREDCERAGLVGFVARACGADRDVRRDFPSGIYRYVQLPVMTWQKGDVFARAYVRWLEIVKSCAFVAEQLRALPSGAIRAPNDKPLSLAPQSLVASLVEGWRGEVCHVALTDSSGRFERYKVVDPSFHNWSGMVVALRDQQISDFPLCNKSFNLSYSGHDL